MRLDSLLLSINSFGQREFVPKLRGKEYKNNNTFVFVEEWSSTTPVSTLLQLVP